MRVTQRHRAILAPVSILILLCGCTDLVSSRSTRSTPEHPSNETDPATAEKCDDVRLFFETKNITVALTENNSSEKSMCNGMCCDEKSEELLRQQAKEDFHSLIRHHSRSVEGLLVTTLNTLVDTATTLVRQSENKTLTLFEQVYRTLAVSSRPSIKALYQAMVDYMMVVTQPTCEQPVMAETLSHLQYRFAVFFATLFPIAYQNTLLPYHTGQNFTEKFRKCLSDSMNEIEPFGAIPSQVWESMYKSLQATRAAIQALNLSRKGLETFQEVIFSDGSPYMDACHDALLRITYCPRCRGIDPAVRPCSGYCANVMRGCLTGSASSFDLVWSLFTEALETLILAIDGHADRLGLNLENAIRRLDSRISDAIMHAMVNGPALQETVRKTCGEPEFEPSRNTTEKPTSEEQKPCASSTAHRAPPAQLYAQLGNFLASFSRVKTFYGSLADSICEEYPDKQCWNGERVGEYTKTVVDSSPMAQKYNPEFTIAKKKALWMSPSPQMNEVIEVLRRLRQHLKSQMASPPESAALLADQAMDGSGSGDRPISRKKGKIEDIDNDDEDAHDDRDDVEGSGSGMGPTTPDPMTKSNPEKSPTAGSSSLLLSSVILAIACVPLIA